MQVDRAYDPPVARTMSRPASPKLAQRVDVGYGKPVVPKTTRSGLAVRYGSVRSFRGPARVEPRLPSGGGGEPNEGRTMVAGELQIGRVAVFVVPARGMHQAGEGMRQVGEHEKN